MGEGSNRGINVDAGTVGLVLAIGALLAFVVQNRNDIQFNWLMIDITMPLWLALIIASVLGGVIAVLGRWLLRRD